MSHLNNLKERVKSMYKINNKKEIKMLNENKKINISENMSLFIERFYRNRNPKNKD